MSNLPGSHVAGSGDKNPPADPASAADAASGDKNPRARPTASDGENPPGNRVDPLDNVFTRLNSSLMTLDFVKAASTTSDPFDAIRDSDRAFVESCKITSLIAAGAINAVNLFGTTLAMSGHHPRVNDNKIKQAFCLGFTLVSVPFTLCVAALAHATERCTSWINKLAYMLYLEYALLYSMCGMYGYLLTDVSPWLVGVFAVSLLLMTYIIIFTVFRRPSILQAARSRKPITASEQLKKELHEPGFPSEQLKTIMRAELKTAEDIQKWLNTPAQPPADAGA